VLHTYTQTKTTEEENIKMILFHTEIKKSAFSSSFICLRLDKHSLVIRQATDRGWDEKSKRRFVF